MSVKLLNVSQNEIQDIFDATKTTTNKLEDDTHNSEFSRFNVVKRTGSLVTRNGNVEMNAGNQVVTIVSDRYQLTQHENVFRNVTDVLDENNIDYSYGKVYVDQREGKNKIYGNLILNDIKVDVDGSPISPSIDIFNSTDGTLPAGILFGAFRSKCENGMLIGAEFSMQKIIHTPSIINKLNFNQVFSKVMAEFNELAESIEKMQQIKIKNVMFETLQKMGFEKSFIKYYPTIVEKYLLDNQESVNQNSLWSLYSTATNFISNYVMLKDFAKGMKNQQIIHTFANNVIKQAA
jgi:hypothetical protein